MSQTWPITILPHWPQLWVLQLACDLPYSDETWYLDFIKTTGKRYSTGIDILEEWRAQCGDHHRKKASLRVKPKLSTIPQLHESINALYCVSQVSKASFQTSNQESLFTNPVTTAKYIAATKSVNKSDSPSGLRQNCNWNNSGIRNTSMYMVCWWGFLFPLPFTLCLRHETWICINNIK